MYMYMYVLCICMCRYFRETGHHYKWDSRLPLESIMSAEHLRLPLPQVVITDTFELQCYVAVLYG